MDRTGLHSKDLMLQCKSLSAVEYLELINEVIGNNNIEDATLLCFYIFDRVMSNVMNNEVTNDEYNELKIVSRVISRLKEANKFDTYTFYEYLSAETLFIPIQVIWWLVKEKVLSLAHFWQTLKRIDLSDELMKFLVSEVNHERFVNHEIVTTFLLELLQGCYIIYASAYRIETSKVWSNYCLNVLNSLTDKTLKIILNENIPMHFQCYVSLLPNIETFISATIIRHFFKSVLQKIIKHEGEEFDLCGAYLNQQFWCISQIEPFLSSTLIQICKYYSFQDIVDIIEDVEKGINLKYTLILIAACTKANNTPNSVKSAIEILLKQSLKKGNFEQFTKTILFIRQSCIEKELGLDYQNWFSTVFGRKSNFKPTQSIFKFLISALTKLIPFEPKSYLTIHIKEKINTLPGFYSLVYDYINLCKARLQELDKFPHIVMNQVEVSVLHMIEESARNNRIDPVLHQLITRQRDDFCKIVVPQILREGQPFVKVKQLLLNSQYSAYITDSSSIYAISDDDDDFIS